MRAPDIDEIATFIRVVRHGSLAGAARELELPKSTVSRRITRLEERLHIELFHRSGRRLHVTKEGRRLYERVAGSVDAIELALRGALEEAAGPSGHIRMTAPADFGRLVLVDELISFSEACPEVTVELQLTDRLVDLVDEGFDLAVRAGRFPASSRTDHLISRRLATTALQLAGSPRLAERISSVSDLEQTPFVLFRTPTTKDQIRLRDASDQIHELSVQGRFIVHDYASMARLVARGLGVGLMPSMHITRADPNAPLVRVLPDLDADAGGIALVYPTRRLTERVKILIEHLRRRLADRID